MRSLFLLLSVMLLASCKSPLPIYFDKPVGVLQDSFPSTMQGNFYPMDEIVRSGLTSYESKWHVKNGKIVLNDTSKKEEEAQAPPTGDTAVSKTTEAFAGEENNFYKIALLNHLSIEHVDSSVDVIDKEKGIVFGFLQISKNKITMIVKDSSGNDHEVTLLQLGPKIKLTNYSDDYYLNLQTPFGWELLKMEAWNKGAYVNIIPFYFTTYNDKTGDEKVFLKSISGIYPNLKPVYNADHLIIGVMGIVNAKAVKESFKKAENNLEMIRASE